MKATSTLVILIAIVIGIFFDGASSSSFSETVLKYVRGAGAAMKHSYGLIVNQEVDLKNPEETESTYRLYSINTHFNQVHDGKTVYTSKVTPLFCYYKKEKKCYNFVKAYLRNAHGATIENVTVGPCVQREVTLDKFANEVHKQYMYSCNFGQSSLLIAPVKNGMMVFENDPNPSNKDHVKVKSIVMMKNPEKVPESADKN